MGRSRGQLPPAERPGCPPRNTPRRRRSARTEPAIGPGCRRTTLRRAARQTTTAWPGIADSTPRKTPARGRGAGSPPRSVGQSRAAPRSHGYARPPARAGRRDAPPPPAPRARRTTVRPGRLGASPPPVLPPREARERLIPRSGTLATAAKATSTTLGRFRPDPFDELADVQDRDSVAAGRDRRRPRARRPEDAFANGGWAIRRRNAQPGAHAADPIRRADPPRAIDLASR